MSGGGRERPGGKRRGAGVSGDAGVAAVGALLGLDAAEAASVVHALDAAEGGVLMRHWSAWAHSGQVAPAGDWRTWVILGGRGFGKTRAGAEWVRGKASRGAIAIALVAATIEEARSVMVEGPSGLLAVCGEREIARWDRAGRALYFASGAVARLYSGMSPEGLRGPEHHIAWCDELAKWRRGQGTWDMLQMGLRKGERPRALVTTTPRQSAVLARILAAADTVVSGGASGDNPHLPPAYLAAMAGDYGGSRLGRMEIDGVMLADVEGALWPEALIAASRGAAPAADRIVRVVVGIDPPASAGGTCGIVACALDCDGVGHVLADHSAQGLSPEGWAKRAAAAAAAHGADRLVAERNQGGDMVAAVLRGADQALPVRLVHAARGKSARAEPVAALFEAGKAKLAGRFPALEAELAGLSAGGAYQGPGTSPDRADAMVWALWALLIDGRGEPQFRWLDI